MKKTTKGAWIIHHANKLSTVTNAVDFDQINFAGKCGTLLSALSTSEQTSLDNPKVEALAKVAGISVRTELPSILTALSQQRLINQGSAGIDVLGLTTSTTLEHTTNIFEGISPSAAENAAIDLSERASEIPLLQSNTSQALQDTYQLSKDEVSELFLSAEQIGFVDAEGSTPADKIYFNGNLFRKGDTKKMAAIVASLKPEDAAKMLAFNQELQAGGCLSLEHAKNVLGNSLLEKLHAIGAYDINQVGNEKGKYAFVTRPGAFNKFSDSVIDDAFDFAKAFVASLTYGMTMSIHSRGKISMIRALMNRLINGYWVGPATAIGHDYKILELKHVIQVRPESNGMFSMKLLKRDVGEIALQVILEGEAGAQIATQLPGAAVTTYTAPEPNRTYIRKNQTEPMKKEIGKLLGHLRTGRI